MIDNDIRENGWVYHADNSHSGSLSCDKDILIQRGVLDQWEVPSEDDFYFWNPEWKLEENRTQYEEEYIDEKNRFMNTYTHFISHCFYVTTPDGTTLSYGDETPHGDIGSEAFTLWWNGLNLDTLSYADMDSWCDG